MYGDASSTWTGFRSESASFLATRNAALRKAGYGSAFLSERAWEDSPRESLADACVKCSSQALAVVVGAIVLVADDVDTSTCVEVGRPMAIVPTILGPLPLSKPECRPSLASGSTTAPRARAPCRIASAMKREITISATFAG